MVNEKGKGDDDDGGDNDGEKINLLGNHIRVVPPVVDIPITVTNDEVKSMILAERSSSPSWANNHRLVMV